jgi:hypothetical protein
MARRQITKLTPHQEAILKLMLRGPNLRCAEIAERVGVTPTWVSIATNSRLFQEEYRWRCEALQEAMLGDVRPPRMEGRPTWC